MQTIGGIKRNRWKLAAILAALAVLGVADSLIARQKRAGDTDSSAWTYSYGDWYYKRNNELVRNQWVDQHTYFVDEDGRMVKDEWVYQRPESDGSYFHSEAIPAAEFGNIDTERLSYVGQDGKIIRNKTIYFTPFQFDNSGFCSLSEENLTRFENAESGIEGLRRYALFNGVYKEYY